MFLKNLGEARILGEKAVARMDGVGAGDFAGRHDRRNVEIALARRRGPDANALVGELDVHRLLVRGRIDGDSGDAELLRRAHDAQSNLSPVRYENLIEHRVRPDHSRIISG